MSSGGAHPAEIEVTVRLATRAKKTHAQVWSMEFGFIQDPPGKMRANRHLTGTYLPPIKIHYGAPQNSNTERGGAGQR